MGFIGCLHLSDAYTYLIILRVKSVEFAVETAVFEFKGLERGCDLFARK